MNMKWALLCAGILLGIGCVSLNENETAKLWVEPDTTANVLWRAGKYHEAMRALPRDMAAWAEYTRRTGSTSEGAAGLLLHLTMYAIVTKGDKVWGKILDDPEIPFEYKTEMIFEIVETRLGKGTIFSSYKSNLIFLPHAGDVNSWEELHKLLRKEIEAKNAGSKDK